MEIIEGNNIDRYGRAIDYARLSVTESCNFSCIYCNPTGERPRHNELSREAIIYAAKHLAKQGVTKIKLTGGEPLLREDIAQIINDIKKINGITSLTLTTNGYYIEKYADDLDLDSINISLDTLSPHTFKKITGADGLENTLRGIDILYKRGIPVKINTVVIKGVNEADILPIAALANKNIKIRYIEYMPMAGSIKGISNNDIKNILDLHFGEGQYIGRLGSGPAVYYKYPSLKGEIGFISPISGKFCSACNRIRLTSEGILKSCLCYDEGVDIINSKNIDEDIRRAIYNKPISHDFDSNKNTHNPMWKFGG